MGRVILIELRRHSKRSPSDKHLSVEGIKLAKVASRTLLENYDIKISSPKARAVETLEIMVGSGHHLIDDEFSPITDITEHYSDKIEQLLKRGLNQVKAHFSEPEIREELLKRGSELFEHLLDLIRDRKGATSVLVVTHGITLEAIVFSVLGKILQPLLDEPIRECEGVRMYYDTEKGEILGYDICRLTTS